MWRWPRRLIDVIAASAKDSGSYRRLGNRDRRECQWYPGSVALDVEWKQPGVDLAVSVLVVFSCFLLVQATLGEQRTRSMLPVRGVRLRVQVGSYMHGTAPRSRGWVRNGAHVRGAAHDAGPRVRIGSLVH